MVISNGTRIKTLKIRMGNLLKVLERITGKVLSTLGSGLVYYSVYGIDTDVLYKS